MHFASKWHAYAVAVLTIITLALSCIDNSMDRWDPDYPADNYQINPEWSAIDTNNLTVLKVYKVPFTQGSEMFDHLSAYAVDTGFIDTVLNNSQLKNDTISLCFLSTGKSSLIIDGFRPNGKHIYDTVKITVTNPYKVNRNNDSFSITPKPAFEITGLNLAVEWKLNDTKPTLLDPSTPFQLPPTLSGAFMLSTSLVDTVRNHRFTIGTVNDSVLSNKKHGSQPVIDSLNIVNKNLHSGDKVAFHIFASDPDSSALTVYVTTNKAGVWSDTFKLETPQKYSSTLTGTKPITDTGTFVFSAKVVDTFGLSSSTVYDSFSVTNPKIDNDMTGPTITPDTPAKDSISTNSSIYTVKLQCIDTSGVLSVKGVMGGQTFTGTRGSGKDWDIIVSGLTPNVFNTIVFTATDSSLRANKSTFTLHIKYDPTMDDMDGPTIKQISGPKSDTVIKDPIIFITDSVVDPSGLDSIYWTLNNVWAGNLAAVSGTSNIFQLRDTLTTYRKNRIVIHAIDNSSHHNHDSAIVILDYNLPPVINDTAVNTKRNTAKTWTLNAQPMDNDTLLWSRLSSPSPLSGSITGTLPSVTFTPVANWSGVDSFYVRVSDGYWSDTAKIKISVIDVPVAPGIITQPASATKNVGQPVTFSVEVNSDVNPVPTYQWKLNGTVIKNASASSYTIGAVSIADSGDYTVTITNSVGTITSSIAKLMVYYAPSIVKQPVSQILYLGKSVTFSVEAKGNPVPNFVWRKNGALIGVTGASYTISSPGVNDSGKYTVTVSNSIDTVISDTARFYAVIKCISAGGNHSLFLKTDGRLFACGANDIGQLGDNTTTDQSVPIQIMTDVDTMSAGSDHSLALKRDGTIWGWGNSGSGQLGSIVGSMQTKPVQITSISGVKKLAAGGGYSMFIKNDGTLLACGQNENGQLGDGTTTSSSTPVQVLNVSNIQSMSVSRHSLILTGENVLLGYGYNYYGNLGDSTTFNRSSPVQVKGMTNVKYATAGGGHSLIIKMDGTLWACGYNYYGQCCDGGSTDHIVPVQVPNINNISAVSAGQSFSMVLKSDGTLWACGSNGYGQLGNGATDSPTSLVQIMSNVQSVSAGGLFSLILKTDGSVWVCGQNSNGQLGDGTTTDRSTPVRITF